ncbi:MAG TPA: MFS transporter [Dehalococcoidia bacterium]|nr:MFS transporter [Dehalococcoidia bacterium]
MTTTTAPAPAPRLRFRLPDAVSVLGERDFRVIWSGQAVSMVGTWMQMVAQGLLVLQLWNNAFALGALNFSNAVPSLLVMLFGGVLADRVEKRRILLVTQFVMMLLALAVGLLVVVDQVQYWMLIVATVGLGIAFGYDMPAYSALLPELVPPEKIGQAVALNSSTFHGTRMIGPAVAGAAIAVFGLAAAYFLNAASFLAVILSLLIIRYRPKPRPAGPRLSAIEGLKEGLRHAKRRPNIQAMLLLTALNTMLIFPVIAILTPFYVRNVLHAGPGVLGAMWAGSGFGSLLGALALVWWGRHWRAQRIWLAAVVAPAGLLVMALTRDAWVAIALQPFVSFAFSSQLGLMQMMMQESTPAEYRGRVMSLSGIAFNGTMPLAALVISGVATVAGLPVVMLACAALYAGSAAWALRFAGGGIERVVATSFREYAAVSPEGAVAGGR